MNVILIEGVVKGYYECPFTVRTGESFVLKKKIGNRGKPFLPCYWFALQAPQVNVSTNTFGQVLVGLL